MSNNRISFPNEPFTRLDFNLLYIAHSKYEGEWQSALHTHHFTEIFFILGGAGEFQVEDSRFPVKAGDCLIVNPHVDHTQFSTLENPMEFVSFGLEGLTLEITSARTGPRNFMLYNFEEQKEFINSHMYLMLEEAEEQKSQYPLICRNMTEIMLIYLMRRHQLIFKRSKDTKMSKECGIAKRYIDSNYMDNITLDLLADLTHMNKFYLVHSFTKYTGLSPINYLTQKRVQVAMDLLASTDYSIAQIASNVGFASQSYFSQVFRKALGTTPVQYRKRHVNDISPIPGNSL